MSTEEPPYGRLEELLASGRRLLTVPEVARMLALSVDHTWEYVRANDLPSLKIGRSVRVDGVLLDLWIRTKVQEGWKP